MATTRIMSLHTGKGRTVGKAIQDIIDYVENPDKTDGGRLISSYQCDSRIADAEFLFAKRQYLARTGRKRGADDVIAYTIRQSFVPGEITPEEANRLGYELARRFTKGKHAFIVCTHVDKAHIHNHIIWNSTTLDHDRKFRDFLGSGRAVRRLNDTICVQNGYAHFITRPIVRLSGISQKLSELDFSWRCRERRTDEIGTLAHNLDELANRLSHSMQELQAANDTLRKDVEREQQLEQAQRDFFSAVSHELKTPITVMKGQLGGMLDGIGVYADRDKYLARSLTVANQMESLVQELLTVSRMERGGELSMIPVELTALIRNCLQNYDELFRQKEQEVVADLPPEIWSVGDPALLKKALGNLLSNAALYSPEGIKIWISARKKGNNIILSVENEGAHIAPEQLPHLFEPFFRSDPSRSRQTGGSGLGLYLVQKIAEQHGGSCQIQNTDRGVCATLILPNSTQTTY